MPGISDFVILRDGTIISVDPDGSYVDGQCSLAAWAPHPHSIADGDGSIERIALTNVTVAVTDPNIKYHLAADKDGYIHVFGEGVLYAYQLDKAAGTLNLIDSKAVGAGTEIAAASLSVAPPTPASGLDYDLGGDFSSDNMQNGWEYMDPTERLLIAGNYLDPDFMCGNVENPLGSTAWSYDSEMTGYGPWDFGDFYLLPWLNKEDCKGGDGGAGDVLTFGPLLIKWTAPEAGDNVEITGALWQWNDGGTLRIGKSHIHSRATAPCSPVELSWTMEVVILSRAPGRIGTIGCGLPATKILR